MKLDKKKMIAAFLIILLGAAGIWGFFWYKSAYFVSTIDSRLDADMVNIYPVQAGRLVDWSVYEGQSVEQYEKLGTVDAGPTVSIINSPIAGKLIQVNAKEGQAVAMSQAVAIVADADNMYVSANIEETEIKKLAEGQGVEIRLDAFPGKVYFGKVTHIGEAAVSVFSVVSGSSSNGNYTKITQLIPVKIDFIENYEDKFKLGMNAEIKIHIK
ncbi:MAG: efflux RND transporter periplasmic adaptor subunit [Clostridiaceae bacterium]